VIAGPRQPPLVHALAHAIAVMLGGPGPASGFAPSPLRPADGDLADLAAALEGGAVDGLLILGANPLATAPGDLPFRAALAKARCRVHLGMYEDETARRCEWFIPQAHELECWGDASAHDGTLSLQQPLIAPLHGGLSPLEALAGLLGDQRPARELVRAAWRGRWRDLDETAFAALFAQSLRRGAAAGTASAELAPEADWTAIPALAAAAPARDAGAWEVSLRIDAKVHDGRFANNPWLQELPDPITKLTWGNAALLSPASARALGVTDGDLLELRHGEDRVEIPALVLPGQADGAIAVALGYGRSGAERTAAGVGSDAYGLRRAGSPWTLPDAQVRGLGGRSELARTQGHWSLEDRPIVLERTRAEFGRQPARPGRGQALASVREAAASEGRQWGMVVDLSACMGCSACVIACQAENNIPVVGRENVRRSREMHWLRVDRYYRGDPDDPVMVSQPMACQHCEKAPCEYVCPTYATTHSHDGLNEMTYNRCVGTRFCSNNCPYKVRRFNWYEFSSADQPLLAMARNPEVTVRARGVMEKCTYCVQRIRTAEIAATVAGRALRTDEVVTACQQACPAQAIVFGDIADPRSAVAGLRASPLAYGVLDETGAQPRTRYLERLSNPNPDLT
jgi:molybdopterin-containing oxidoreductase family iron-sulfur binding subunit